MTPKPTHTYRPPPALCRERARRDLGLSANGLLPGERGKHPWCPSPEARTRHSYEGRPCSTPPCLCALPGASVPRAEAALDLADAEQMLGLAQHG